MTHRWFVRGDIDGFFGLFVDNLLQLMVIAVLGRVVSGLPTDLITGRILPGAAVSILIGNLLYAWQARRLMRESGRTDVTALPYGINTPSLLAFLFLIMGPIYQETGNPTLAWQAGLLACLLSGIMETAGAFVGDWMRRHTPRAALLSALAGVAITFIAMGFTFQIFAAPAIALLPMLMILISYASHARLPLGMPGGLAAVLVGTGLAWILRAAGVTYFQPPAESYRLALYPPIPAVGELLAVLQGPMGWRFLSVIVPMGLFNVIGSLQNLESAEAAGDRYPTRSSLLINGIGSVMAALFGSAFPTTIYIGHPGWKAMGARAGYSILNGTIIAALCLLGGVTLILQYIPIEATLGILLWIGIIMTAQAFQEVPKRHALAVAFGLVPSLAAWALTLIETVVQKAGGTLFEVAPAFGRDLHIYGIIALSQGFLLSSMILAAILVSVIEREFLKAGIWTAIAAGLSMIGLIHAYDLVPSGVQNRIGIAAAPEFALMYGLGGLFLLTLHLNNNRHRS
jgi:adenine/guanine/hypoxanthine permease